MFQLNYKDRRPLYEQIKERIKTLMLNSVLKPNEKITSIPGKGSFVSPQEQNMNQIKLDDLMNQLEKIVSEALYLGLPKEKITSLINSLYEKQKGGIENDWGQKPNKTFWKT